MPLNFFPFVIQFKPLLLWVEGGNKLLEEDDSKDEMYSNKASKPDDFAVDNSSPLLRTCSDDRATDICIFFAFHLHADWIQNS